MGKLWIARILALLSAVALGAVVLEEHRDQERESAAPQTIFSPSEVGHVIDLRVDGYAQPRAVSTVVYRSWSAERRPGPGRAGTSR